MNKTYDFRSDTVTLPTAEMMRAIAAAPLGIRDAVTTRPSTNWNV